jgi:hypothetical protein
VPVPDLGAGPVVRAIRLRGCRRLEVQRRARRRPLRRLGPPATESIRAPMPVRKPATHPASHWWGVASSTWLGAHLDLGMVLRELVAATAVAAVAVVGEPPLFLSLCSVRLQAVGRRVVRRAAAGARKTLGSWKGGSERRTQTGQRRGFEQASGLSFFSWKRPGEFVCVLINGGRRPRPRGERRRLP